MTDPATAIAEYLVESGDPIPQDETGEPDWTAFRRKIQTRFPLVGQAAIERGISIAVEVVLMDGRRP